MGEGRCTELGELEVCVCGVRSAPRVHVSPLNEGRRAGRPADAKRAPWASVTRPQPPLRRPQMAAPCDVGSGFGRARRHVVPCGTGRRTSRAAVMAEGEGRGWFGCCCGLLAAPEGGGGCRGVRFVCARGLPAAACPAGAASFGTSLRKQVRAANVERLPSRAAGLFALLVRSRGRSWHGYFFLPCLFSANVTSVVARIPPSAPSTASASRRASPC